MAFRSKSCAVAIGATALALACHACGSFGEATADTPTSLDGGAKPSSCRELLARDPSLGGKDGLYDVATPDAGTVKVHCDMTTNGGGWTLVGRSGTEVPGSGLTFGWTSATGDVANDKRPYSLDVASSGIAFDEVLVTARDRSHAFKFPVSSDFLSHAKDIIPSGTVSVVAGGCPTTGGPSMLKYTGETSLDDLFFFRDIQDDGQHRGLLPGGFDLSYKTCDQAGFLDGQQGDVLVR